MTSEPVGAEIIRLRPGAGRAARPAPAVPEELLTAVDAYTLRLIEGRRRGLPHRRRLVRRSLVVADLLALVTAFVATLLIRGAPVDDRVSTATEALLFALTLPGWLAVAKLHGLYDRDEERADNSTVDDVVSVFHLVTIGAWLLVAGCLVTNSAQSELPKVVTLWALGIVGLPAFRAVARGLCRRSIAYVQNTVIVGAGSVGQLIARKLVSHPEYGLNVVGFVDPFPRERREDLPAHLSILGDAERLPEIIRELDVERVIVAYSGDAVPRTLALVRSVDGLNVQIDLVPRLYEVVGAHMGVHMIEGFPLLGLGGARMTPSARALKRAVDVVGSGLLLLATAPLFPVIAWLIRRDSPGPVFFRQTRLGYLQREFTALKFRTMRVGTDDAEHRDYIRRTMSADASAEASGTFKLDREDAITPVGRWLRKTSLDELPQLINVLRGDMSLVGPRPCIPYEVEHFRPHQFDRFNVPQGLTGLWQVAARASATFGEALDMDVAYVRGWSFGLDLRLLARTPLELVRQRSRTS